MTNDKKKFNTGDRVIVSQFAWEASSDYLVEKMGKVGTVQDGEYTATDEITVEFDIDVGTVPGTKILHTIPLKYLNHYLDLKLPRTVTFDEVKVGDCIAAMFSHRGLMSVYSGVVGKVNAQSVMTRDSVVICSKDSSPVITLLSRDPVIPEIEEPTSEGAAVSFFNAPSGLELLAIRRPDGRWAVTGSGRKFPWSRIKVWAEPGTLKVVR